MRKNGFTLIELLAVVVILAIIALITIPLIAGITKDSRKESNQRSVDLYANAIRNGISTYELNHIGEEVRPGTYCTSGSGCEKLPFDVEAVGNIDCSTIQIYEDGTFYLAGCKVNGKDVDYTYGKSTVKLCTANKTKATALVWQGSDNPSLESSYEREDVGLLASTDGAYTPGVAYTCNFIDDDEANNMTFFVLSSTEKEVTLIAGFNIFNDVAWSSDGDNHINDPEDKQAVTAKAKLSEIMSNNASKLTDAQKATIKLPTKAQIEGAYTGTLPKWLNSFTTSPVSFGYWTATPDSSASTSAWIVVYDGLRTNATFNLTPVVQATDGLGIRPVITISTSDIE